MLVCQTCLLMTALTHPPSCAWFSSSATLSGDSKDAFHTSIGVFVNNHALDSPFMVQSANTVNKHNGEFIPDDWSCGANPKGSMTVDLFMSLCVHHVENNLKPKGFGAGGKPSILIFDGHASRWSYAGLMYLMANNCWPFCLASHTSAWAQVANQSYISYTHTHTHTHTHITHSHTHTIITPHHTGWRLRRERDAQSCPGRRSGAVEVPIWDLHRIHSQ